MEHEERFGKTKTYNTYKEKFLVFVQEILPLLPEMRFDKSDEQHTWDYLLHRKSKYITEEDIDRHYHYICEKRNGTGIKNVT
jgi:hypothetical protein